MLELETVLKMLKKKFRQDRSRKTGGGVAAAEPAGGGRKDLIGCSFRQRCR